MRLAAFVLAAALSALDAAPSRAQNSPPGPALPPIPLGIPACDRFLAAYERCAASPGLPEVARPGMWQGISGMRESFRTAARDERARRTLDAQCAQTHETVRQALIRSFQCEFPSADTGPPVVAKSGSGPSEPSAPASDPLPPAKYDAPPGAAAALPAARAPLSPPEVGRALAAPRADAEVEKANAYADVQNSIVTFHPFARNLADYRRSNERVLRPGARVDANAWFSFSGGDYEGLIERLRAAQARPAPMPELDAAAARLAAALETLQPTARALNRYQTTREFQRDGFRFARETSPRFVAEMEAAAAAADAFEAALFDREAKRDARALAALPADAPARVTLEARVAARGLARALDGASARDGRFEAALGQLTEAGSRLNRLLDGLTPRPAASCRSYAESLDTLVGRARGVLGDVRSGSRTGEAARSANNEYNRSVERLASCERDEPRLFAAS